MKNKFILVYGITAFIILLGAIVWFSLSVSSEADRGSIEAERSFSWISREAASTAVSDGFMTDIYIQKLTDICQKSKLLSAVVINTSSGTVFAWPKQSSSIQFDMSGKPQINNRSMFMKVFSSNLDIGAGNNSSVIITAVLYVLLPDTLFTASRNSFLLVLSLLLITFIVILFQGPFKDKKQSIPAEETVADIIDETFEQKKTETINDTEEENGSGTIESPQAGPEGLFSPLTGIGWEQYLMDRLDAELVRAASSEQDLTLIIIRVSGLLHTDLLSKKIAAVLLETFKFRDLVFEYGSNGFAGILQNIHLDQAMKIADSLYAGIDSILMELAYKGQITIGITTRTARLIPAFRMIEEALSAAKKAVEEPSLPIVAFRANPEKYRNYVAEKI